METVRATMEIQVIVNCPSCGEFINLLDEEDTAGTDHNDDGEILKQSCPTTGQYWREAHERFAVDDVQCSYCGSTFQVKGLDW